MAELLASLQDVNRWLPVDKLRATDVNTAEFQIEALQLIRGQLASSFSPTILASWSNPSNTPGIIRSIASRLIAAFLYREVYSEDTANLPPYAVALYNEAVMMLAEIRSGNLLVLDDNGNLIDNTLLLSAGDVWPNNSTDGPYFTMTQKFG